MRGFSTEVRQCSKHSSLKSSLSSFFPVFVTVEGILAVCEEVRAIRVSRIECEANREKMKKMKKIAGSILEGPLPSSLSCNFNVIASML